MMPLKTITIRDNILLQALPAIPFDGWLPATIAQAALDCGYQEYMVPAVFPMGMPDVMDHFSDWADRQMLDSVPDMDIPGLRVRDRIKSCVLARIDALSPWREATRKAMSYWAHPLRQAQATRIVWRTADRIWIRAGDTATDYNFYTKRVLLSSVLGATTLAWLGQDTESRDQTEAFVDRRIENVLKLGKILGKMKSAA